MKSSGFSQLNYYESFYRTLKGYIKKNEDTFKREWCEELNHVGV